MSHVLADKLVLLPFVPGQGDVVEHLPPLRTDEAVAVYEIDLGSLMQGWACDACVLPNGFIEINDLIPLYTIRAAYQYSRLNSGVAKVWSNVAYLGADQLDELGQAAPGNESPAGQASAEGGSIMGAASGGDTPEEDVRA
eukprot:9165298-Alexandrium_andersonii.AAC.1